MERNLFLAVDNTKKLSARELSALTLCRNALETCVDTEPDRCAVTAEGELITFSSAIEIFDSVLNKKIKETL